MERFPNPGVSVISEGVRTSGSFTFDTPLLSSDCALGKRRDYSGGCPQGVSSPVKQLRMRRTKDFGEGFRLLFRNSSYLESDWIV
jgi:hypothetical protein